MRPVPEDRGDRSSSKHHTPTQHKRKIKRRIIRIRVNERCGAFVNAENSQEAEPESSRGGGAWPPTCTGLWHGSFRNTMGIIRSVICNKWWSEIGANNEREHD